MCFRNAPHSIPKTIFRNARQCQDIRRIGGHLGVFYNHDYRAEIDTLSLGELANLSETVGAVGVIVSVIYLAIQIRNQTEEARLSATRELAAQFQDCLKSAVADEKLSEIWLKGVKDYDSLPDVERFRAAVMFHDLFRSAEQQYFHTRTRNVEGLYLNSMDNYFLEFLSFPGIRSWWKSSKHSFESNFQEHIESAMERSKEKVFNSTFKKSNEKSA